MDRKLSIKMIGHVNFTPNKPTKKCYKVLLMLVGDVFFLGKISSLEKKRKEKRVMNLTKDFLRIVLQILPYFEEKMLEFATFRHSIHGGR
jgi:hypothetical protein